jgi:predicted nucleic acid-binding protein
LLSANDAHHQAAIAALTASSELGRSLSTTWEVVGEAYTLLRMRASPERSAEPALVVLRWARESGVNVLTTTIDDHDRAGNMLRQYSDHRLSYVDALVLAIAERCRVEEILTADERHFRAVRLAHQATITVV